MLRQGGWAFLLIGLMSTMSAVAQTPPRDLRLEGDHWTAWDPPPAEADSYIVQRGDTLWTLAARFLGDGNLWPQIWEPNRYVLDAHWIYPGDPLTISGAQQAYLPSDDIVGAPLEDGSAQASAGDGAFGEGDGSATSADDSFLESRLGSSLSDAPIPLGFEADIYCSGYIGDDDEEFAYHINGSEFEFLTPTLDPQARSDIKGLYGKTDTQKYGLTLGDIVYVDSGRGDGLSAGELLTVIQKDRKVRHPLEEVVVGRYYKYLGRLRILSVQETTAIAEIVAACDPIPVGSALRAFEPEPVPLRRLTPMRPANFPHPTEALEGTATIIEARDKIVSLGEGHMVFLDRGYENDVAPGDIFTIYRRGRRGMPPIVMGELGVLSVYKGSALARILRSRYTIFVGDALVPK